MGLVFINFLILMIGASFGSFLKIVVDRRKLGESILYPPSHCDFCGKRLYKRDMIPIFSFIWLRAKCRFCGEKIGYSKILTELVSALVFFIIFKFYSGFELLFIWAGALVGILISLTDIDQMEVYEFDLYILLGLGIIYRLIFLGFDFQFFKIVLIFILVFLLIRFLTKNAIGDGDLFFYLALFLFIDSDLLVEFILLSLWIGGIYGLILAIKKRTLKAYMPLCPSIFVAFVLLMIIKDYL